jgi:hypothetical protein
MSLLSIGSNWRTVVIGITVFGFFGVWFLNAPSGPKAELVGLVQVAGLDASSKYRLPQEIVEVKLDDGNTVSAAVTPGLVALAGDRVRVHVYERVLTGARVYQVFARANGKAP